MFTPSIFAVDPGLATFGLTFLTVPADGTALVDFVAFHESKKAAARLNLLASDDTAERARELYFFLDRAWIHATTGLREMGPAPRAIFAEAQSWPRNAGASAKVGVAWGVLVAFAAEHDLPILQLSPQKVKRHLCGVQSASKKEVELEVRKRAHFTDDDAEKTLASLAKSKHEHIYDAVAVGLCAGIHPGWSLVRGGR